VGRARDHAQQKPRAGEDHAKVVADTAGAKDRLSLNCLLFFRDLAEVGHGTAAPTPFN